MKKRILVLLSVVALMVVMVAMSVAPASAKVFTFGHCQGGQGSNEFREFNPSPNNVAHSICAKL